MALISGTTLIRSISLFHLTLAYYFLTNPHKLADQNVVFIFGESMGIVSLLSLALIDPSLIIPHQPHTQALNHPTAPASFLAAVLAFVGISDLVAASLPDEVGHYHWGNQGQLR